MSEIRKKANITLQDIAEATGYSKNTVSLGMRNSERLPDSTIKLIQKTAEQLGYKPNLTARNLTTGKSGLIGVYASSLHDAVRTELVNGLITELRSAQYSPVLGLGEGHSGSWHTSAWVKTLKDLSVEAMVVVREFLTEIPAEIADTPVIVLGCQPHPSLKCDYAALDRAEAASRGIKYLTDHGHRNIFIYAGRNSHFETGCVNEASKRNAKWFIPDWDISTSKASLQKLLEYVTHNKKSFSAIIFGDSPTAVEFLTLLSDRGVRVPEDMAIISYDYLPYARHLKVPLTTITQPIENLVSMAVFLVQNRLEKPGSKYIHRTLKHKIVPGESV